MIQTIYPFHFFYFAHDIITTKYHIELVHNSYADITGEMKKEKKG